MCIRKSLTFSIMMSGAACLAQSLGFLQYDSPYDSLRKSDRFPVYPAVSWLPNKGAFKRFLPLMDIALQTENPLKGKLRGGFNVDLERSMFFLRFSSIIGVYSNYSLFNHNGLTLRTSPMVQWDPSLRIGIKPSTYFSAQIGLDRNFYGEGARSLFISDFGKPYPFASTRFNIGPVNYQAMLAYLYNKSGQQKFQMSHLLHASIGKRIDVQLFESVIFNCGDSIAFRSFDPYYLNPFVVIRPQEYALGSGDNVLLGIGASWMFPNKGKLYGQFALDDFLLNAVLKQSKYWGNKFAFQLGWKHQFTKNKLNYKMRIEANVVRPYTYSHLGESLSYTNGSQVLAHPLGANFWEGYTQLTVSKKAWSLWGIISFGAQGVDSSAVNFGSNIFLPYTNRPYDFGVALLQGKTTSFINTRIQLSYSFNKFFLKEAFCEVLIQHFRNQNFTYYNFTPLIGIKSPLFNDYRF